MMPRDRSFKEKKKSVKYRKDEKGFGSISRLFFASKREVTLEKARPRDEKLLKKFKTFVKSFSYEYFE